MTSCPGLVYIHKDVEEIEREGAVYYSYQESLCTLKEYEEYAAEQSEQAAADQADTLANLLLNQAEIQATQAEQDDVLADILLNQMGDDTDEAQ